MEIIEAVEEGDIARVQRLVLVNPANVNATDEDGATPLILAAAEGNVPIGVALIKAGANINARDIGDDSALICAVVAGHREFVILLLEQQEYQKLDMHWALGFAGINGNLDMVNLLLASGSNPNGEGGDDSPLISTSRGIARGAARIIPIIDTLLAHGADINKPYETSANMESPLMFIIDVDNSSSDDALQQTFLKVVRRFIEDPNLDIDKQDANGKTTLMHALEQDNVDLVKLILSAQPDPNIKDNEGQTARAYIGKLTRHLLKTYIDNYNNAKRQANQELSKRAMLLRRFQTGTNIHPQLQLPPKQLSQYIFTKSIYDELCTRLGNGGTRPQLQELARSLHINSVNKSKTALCQAIRDKIKL